MYLLSMPVTPLEVLAGKFIGGAIAVGAALFLWLSLVFLGDLGLMGTAIVLRLKAGALLTAAMINPLQIFKIAALWNIRNNLEVLGPAGLYATRTFADNLPLVLFASLLAWITVPLLATMVVFRQRGAL